MRLAETRAALRRNLSGGRTDWSDELLDGAVVRAADDLNRIMPLQKVKDFTLTFAVTDEEWNSGTLGTTITLANKRLAAKKETVQSTDGNTKHVRDADYTIDYAAGTIVALATGSIPTDTVIHISYTIMQVYVDLSSLTDLIRVARVEYPAGAIPSNMETFFTWGDFLVVTSRGRETQQAMEEKGHMWVYYQAGHTLPAKTVDGSWSPQLDEVVLKGAEGYSLLTKALELRFSTKTRQASSLTALGELAAIVTQIDASLTNTQTQASSASSDLDDIDAKLDDMVAALAASSTYLASAGSALTLALARATAAASAITAVDTPLTDANAKLNEVDTYLFAEVTERLDRAESFVSLATAHLDSGAVDLVTLEDDLANSLSHIAKIDSLRAQASAKLVSGAGEVASADDYIRALPDAILNALSASIPDPIIPVSNNITAAGNQLIQAVSVTDKVNIGENVSEMYRRYADSWGALGRLEYEAWLTWLGRVDRRLAQGNGLLAKAGEYRGIADGYIGEANTALGEIASILNKVATRQNNAAQWGEVARGRISQGQTVVNAANVGLGTARGILDEADGYLAIAGVRLNAARTDAELINAYITVAAQYVGMAQAKIAEGEALRTPVDAILERASMKVEIARIYQQESDRRLQQLGLKQQEADRYLAIAASETELADKFEEAGVRARDSFMGVLRDRAQVQADTSLSPARQEAP